LALRLTIAIDDSKLLRRMFDVIIVGGGAAGLFAAIRIASRGRRTLVLEKNRLLGVKILMSGGTRCNITHRCDPRGIVDAFGKPGRFLHSALAAMPPDRVVELIESQGVATKVEPGGKIFPVSNRAVDVRDAIVRAARNAGAQLSTERAVKRIDFQTDRFILSTDTENLESRTVILTTGGQSYPGCGTTGDGYQWAQGFGHQIITPVAALTPLRTALDWPKVLSGLTIDDVAIQVRDPSNDDPRDGSRALAHTRGAFLFTHFGFSGPAVLNISRVVSRHSKQNTLKLICDFCPELSGEHLLDNIRSQTRQAPGQNVVQTLGKIVPRRLAVAILESASLSPSLRGGQLSNQALHSICTQFKNATFPISGVMGFKKAEVTAGGVSLGEVDSRTMESKLRPGLFLAGEILDVDGPIGGYNFQAAFSTGWLAGEHAG
jgi:predicted Rossmann fold flavoprotein